MERFNHNTGDLPRQEKFPFRVKMLYLCSNLRLASTPKKTPDDVFEVSIRLKTEGEEICCDLVNGVLLKQPFPHAAFKMPGSIWEGRSEVRNTIAFSYEAPLLEEFRRLGMYPESLSKPFVMSKEIEKHISSFRSLRTKLYTPGIIDRMDWLCFQLLREILLDGNERRTDDPDSEKIKNISLWFQLHFNESFSIEETALAHGFSRSGFFRKWKETFEISPVQYLLDLKIEAAANFLCETDMSVSDIVSKVNFSGMTAFYRRFAARYGCTPDAYRRKSRLQN